MSKPGIRHFNLNFSQIYFLFPPFYFSFSSHRFHKSLFFQELELNSPELLALWKKLADLTPFPELEQVGENNLAKFDESGDLFKAFRSEKTWRSFRSDISRNFHCYENLGSAIEILRKLVSFL